MNNLDFQARPVRFNFGEQMGLKVPAGSRLQLVEHFPHRTQLIAEGASLTSGQMFNTWLRPFEVALWEVSAESQAANPDSSLQKRMLSSSKADAQSQRLELAPDSALPAMEVIFAQPDSHFRSTEDRPVLEEFQKQGYQKRTISRRARLPHFEGSQVLAIVVRLQKEGKWWRCHQPSDLLQASATIAGHPIRLEAVPNFRQTDNNQLAPWLVFKIRTNPGWSGADFRVAISGYLPPEVEWEEEGWLVPEWWM
jgi:hypothetical protein